MDELLHAVHMALCGVPSSVGVSLDDIEAARAELAALRARSIPPALAKVVEDRAVKDTATEIAIECFRDALIDALRTWRFDDGQFHAHSWHDREDWVARHPIVKQLRAALRGETDEKTNTKE